MCGRFYIDEDLQDELEQMIKELDRSLTAMKEIKMGEVFPTNQAAVFVNQPQRLKVAKWGFPGRGENKVIFNARSETVLQKRMFEQGFLEQRCLVPVSGFYEWNSKKEKFYFKLRDGEVMYLGAIMDSFQGEERFTILTREADEDMKPIHSRMPVIISQDKAVTWYESLSESKRILYEPQARLCVSACQEKKHTSESEYEQIHIFNTFDL